MGATIAGGATLVAVGIGFMLAGAALLLSRSWWAFRLSGVLLPTKHPIHLAVVRALLGFGAIVTLAQVADFLYAPTDYILIDRLLRPIDIATYARSRADRRRVAAAGDGAGVRRAPPRGRGPCGQRSCCPAAILLAGNRRQRGAAGNGSNADLADLSHAAAHLAWKRNAGNARPTAIGAGEQRHWRKQRGGTIHSPRCWACSRAGHCRSGIGSGQCGVQLSVRQDGRRGLRGIVLGTSVALIGRCAVWMPWYVLKTLVPQSPDPLSGTTGRGLG